MTYSQHEGTDAALSVTVAVFYLSPGSLARLSAVAASDQLSRDAISMDTSINIVLTTMTPECILRHSTCDRSLHAFRTIYKGLKSAGRQTVSQLEVVTGSCTYHLVKVASPEVVFAPSGTIVVVIVLEIISQ